MRRSRTTFGRAFGPSRTRVVGSRAARSVGTALVLAVSVLGATGEGARAEAPAPDGRALYEAKCATCHQPDGTGSYLGPDITRAGLASVDFQVRTGRMPLEPDATRRAQQRLTPAEMEAIDDYVGRFVTGPPIPEVDVAAADVSAGQQLYALNCAACHQAVGAGGVLAYDVEVPPLENSGPTEVAEAIRTGPGQMPVFGPQTLSPQAVGDIAAYVQTLRDPADRGGFALGHLGPVPEGLAAWGIGLSVLVVITRRLGTREPSG